MSRLGSFARQPLSHPVHQSIQTDDARLKVLETSRSNCHPTQTPSKSRPQPAPTMAGQTTEGEVVRETTLAIDTRCASIVVVPKSDEVNDANVPRNLHNAAELFLGVGVVENAERVKDNTGRMLDMCSDNPDGKTNVKIGQGCVCWSCGFCGLPKGGGESKVAPGGKKNNMPKTPPGPCGNCGETDQINYVRVTRKGMDDLPWIEAPPLTEEEKKKKKDAELAAKRREVEEQVKKALEDRKKAEASAWCMAMQGSFMPGQQAGQGIPCVFQCVWIDLCHVT